MTYRSTPELGCGMTLAVLALACLVFWGIVALVVVKVLGLI